MSELPVELKYAPSHEWARLDSDGTVVIGITVTRRRLLAMSFTLSSLRLVLRLMQGQRLLLSNLSKQLRISIHP